MYHIYFKHVQYKKRCKCMCYIIEQLSWRKDAQLVQIPLNLLRRFLRLAVRPFSLVSLSPGSSQLAALPNNGTTSLTSTATVARCTAAPRSGLVPCIQFTLPGRRRSLVSTSCNCKRCPRPTQTLAPLFVLSPVDAFRVAAAIFLFTPTVLTPLVSRGGTDRNVVNAEGISGGHIRNAPDCINGGTKDDWDPCFLVALIAHGCMIVLLEPLGVFC